MFLFSGAFLRLRSRTSKDHTPHKTIESVAHNKITAFLNLTKFAGYRVVPTNGAPGEFPRVDYLPGNVFACDNIYTGSAKFKQDGKILLHKHSSSKEANYLKCRDEKDNEIIVPLTQTGEFVEILKNDLSGNGKLSVSSNELIEKQKFPIIVRYVKGRFRPRLNSFTGLFTLIDSYEESTIIGCVLDKNGYTLIELPLSSPLTFHLALNYSDLQTHVVVKGALKLCNVNVHNFARDLKFKFKFAQRFLQMGNKKVTLDDTGDDPGETPSARNSAKIGHSPTYIYV